MKIRLYIAGILLSLTSLSAFSANPDADCPKLTLENAPDVLGTHQPEIHKVRNPFRNDQCVTVYYSNQLFKDPDIKHFWGDDTLMKSFYSGRRYDGPQVTKARDKNGQFQTFLSLDMSHKTTQDFKKEANTMSLLERHFEEFMHLHEIVHLDPSNTINPKWKVKQKEGISDIGAALLLSSKYKMDTETFSTLMANIREARRKHFKRHGDHTHYDKRLLSKAVGFTKNLKDEDITLHVSTIQEASALARLFVEHKGDALVDEVLKTHQMFSEYYQEFGTP